MNMADVQNLKATSYVIIIAVCGSNSDANLVSVFWSFVIGGVNGLLIITTSFYKKETRNSMFSMQIFLCMVVVPPVILIISWINPMVLMSILQLMRS
jgi:hypothetical protein